MLDLVGERARSLNQSISRADRQRVEEYFESVRDVERQLQMSLEWVGRAKPTPVGSEPKDIGDNQQQKARFQLMIDMIHLALVTDSTRAVSLMTFGMHHDLSHHGKEPKKLAACRHVEIELMQAFGSLLKKLKDSKEAGGNLLDSTMVMMTSNLRDGNTHWTYNLPAILAGGGFRHGQHLVFPRENNAPLSNLFVSMMQRMGVEADSFASSTGPLRGLELV